MQGIRNRQRLLVELLTTKAYNKGDLRPSTQQLLDDTIRQCAEYERRKRPFNHDIKGPQKES